MTSFKLKTVFWNEISGHGNMNAHRGNVKFSCNLSVENLRSLAEQYKNKYDDEKELVAGAKAKHRGWLEKSEFELIAKWKSSRPSRLHKSNDVYSIKIASQASFSSESDLERIIILTFLSGVRVRTASAILHICFPDKFPLMDVRAFNTLGISPETTSKWEDTCWLRAWPIYCQYCRTYSANRNIDLRTLDRALYQHGG